MLLGQSLASCTQVEAGSAQVTSQSGSGASGRIPGEPCAVEGPLILFPAGSGACRGSQLKKPPSLIQAAGGRSTEDLQRLSASQKVTTKVPPSSGGKSTWFAFEDAVDEWREITELEPEERGPALPNRREGEAVLQRLLDRDTLKHKEDGVKYVKRFLWPFFEKGTAKVFFYRIQQFMNMHRGSGGMLVG